MQAPKVFYLLHCSAKKIVMAVKAGGGPDPEKNRQLAQVIADAKVNNVPRDVIERQLSKANAAATIGDNSLSECLDCVFLFKNIVAVTCIFLIHT